MPRYLVITLRLPAFDPKAITPHYEFLDRLRSEQRLELAGPFTDRSGGAYVIQADNLSAAEAIAHSDPLHLTHSSQITVREWAAN